LDSGYAPLIVHHSDCSTTPHTAVDLARRLMLAVVLCLRMLLIIVIPFARGDGLKT
jgi:hypothetical protein